MSVYVAPVYGPPGANGHASRGAYAPRRLRATVLLVVTAVSAGCKVAPPRYEEPQVFVDEAWQSSLPQQVAAAAPGDAGVTLERWWTRFGDDLLDRLVSDALAHNTDLRAALLSLRIAVLDRADSESDYRPQVDARASARRIGGSEDATEDVSTFALGLGASWEMDLWGAGQARRVESGESLEAVRQDLRDIQVSLVAETALNYAQLRSAQLQLDVTRRNVNIQRQTLQFTEWQREVGMTTELEVTRARSNLERTRAQIPGLEDDVNRVVNRLQALTGRSTSDLRAGLLESQALPKIPESIVVGVPADALRQRPDVRAAEHRLRAQAARVAEAGASRLPSLTLTGDLGRSSRLYADLFDLGSFVHALAASIAVTVFDSGRLKRDVERQRLGLEATLVDYEAVLRGALEEAENALSALDNVQKEAQALVAAEEAAKLAAQLAGLQYQSGLVDFQTVLDTQRTLLDAQSSLAVNRGNEMAGVIQLYRALGGGWQNLFDGIDAAGE